MFFIHPCSPSSSSSSRMKKRRKKDKSQMEGKSARVRRRRKRRAHQQPKKHRGAARRRRKRAKRGMLPLLLLLLRLLLLLLHPRLRRPLPPAHPRPNIREETTVRKKMKWIGHCGKSRKRRAIKLALGTALFLPLILSLLPPQQLLSLHHWN